MSNPTWKSTGYQRANLEQVGLASLVCQAKLYYLPAIEGKLCTWQVVKNVKHLALTLGCQDISSPYDPVSRTAPEEISSGGVVDKTGNWLGVTCELPVDRLLPPHP